MRAVGEGEEKTDAPRREEEEDSVEAVRLGGGSIANTSSVFPTMPMTASEYCGEEKGAACSKALVQRCDRDSVEAVPPI